ncbi:thioredoxin domain-containing protein 5 [Dermacentor albipictus]|uniref:thioredoxin domain-containing protein 5 n=1 Tax=Dermacentor albipictus TaxID=60249 RepID=UPI0038FC8AA2
MFSRVSKAFTMFHKIFVTLTVLLAAKCVFAVSSDPDLEKFLITVAKHDRVAVIFTQECCTCTDCVELEQILNAKQQELSEDYGVGVVKVVSKPQIEERYGVTSRPTLVFFRQSVPAVFEGRHDPDSILEWIGQSLEPSVKALDDNSFEHLTQAATGATTGNWLVVFHTDKCVKKDLATGVLEGLSSQVKGATTVAKVDIDRSPGLVERFSIKECPTILFFRLGKMYKYNVKKLEIKSLKNFVDGLYKNMKAHPVPVLQTPFDKLVEKIADFIKEHRRTVMLGFVAFFSVTYTLYKALSLRNTQKQVKKD